jgi:predicted RNA binding protein with dsRBD fold (UPF0201 family)
VATTPLNIKVGVKGQGQVDKLNSSLGKTANSSTRLGSALKIAGTALAALGVARLVRGFVDVGKEVESLQLRFKFLFGSAEEGAKAFKVLNTFAARVPFSLGEIAAASGNLAVVSKDAEALNKNLALTANIAAVAGLDFRTAGEQLQRAFSGGAAAADLFRERGVTALLGFEQGATISIEQTIEKFNELFGPGGKFGDAAKEMANTFTGTLSMISDSFRKFQEAVVLNFFGELKTQFGDLDTYLKEHQQQIEIMAGVVGNLLAKSLRAAGTGVRFFKDNIELIVGALSALMALKVAGMFLGIARSIAAIVAAQSTWMSLTVVGIPIVVAAVAAGGAAYLAMNKIIDDLAEATEEAVIQSEFNVKATKNAHEETAKFTKQVEAATKETKKLERVKFNMFESDKKLVEANKQITKAVEKLERVKFNMFESDKKLVEANKQITKAVEKTIVKYKFYEDQIIRAKRSQEAATKSAQEFEDLLANKVIIQALREVIGEGFTPLQGKIAAIADAMNTFRDTASSTLTDVIMGTKKLNEALGEIVNQTLRALIQGFINLGITIFILEPLERWLRKQVQGQQQLNNQLRKTLALETAIAAVKGIGSMFGIPFFAEGGRTPANQPMVVGERGPELFVPNTAGNVMSNDDLQASGDVSSGGDIIDVTFNINTIDSSDFDSLLTTRQDLIMGLINRGLAERGKRSLIA